MQGGYADVVPIFIQGIWTTTFAIQLFCEVLPARIIF
jgi:hypothetical protein